MDDIKRYFPPIIRENSLFQKYMLKEYLQLLILDFLSNTPFIRKITFIGGTSIRLTKGIDRFSEDLDFDCKDFSLDEFMVMTDGIIKFLRKNGFGIQVKDKENTRLIAFRRNIYFPELLYNYGLSGHPEERFLIKVECQDQFVPYIQEVVNIKGCGFLFPMPVPPIAVLCAMKVSAMLNRKKGRDFYDVLFLLMQSLPDFGFLNQKMSISNLEELKISMENVINQVDMKNKMRDFEHLLFNKGNSARILRMNVLLKELLKVESWD